MMIFFRALMKHGLCSCMSNMRYEQFSITQFNTLKKTISWSVFSCLLAKPVNIRFTMSHAVKPKAVFL